MSGNWVAANNNAVFLGTDINSPGNARWCMDTWIYLRAHNDARIIDKSTGTSGSDINWQLAIGLAGGISRTKMVIDGNSLTGNTNISLNEWHHVLGNYTGSVMELYLDGLGDGSKAESGAILVSAKPCRVGSVGNDPTARNLEGCLYRTRLFDRDLDSGDEISTIYFSKGDDNIVSGLQYEWLWTEGPPGVSIGANVIKNTGPIATAADGSGEGSPLPTWDDQDLMTSTG